MVNDSHYLLKQPLMRAICDEEDIACVITPQVAPALADDSSYAGCAYRSQNCGQETLAAAGHDTSKTYVDRRGPSPKELF